ncbi:MAG: hypothetical protein F4Y03_06475 [Alphaproteobacteria bacterium]|nr:hypothetical protein [Alphaproteobacteria bacterium]
MRFDGFVAMPKRFRMAVFVAVLLLWGGQQTLAADVVVALGQACHDAYQGSTADSYCSDETISWWSAATPADGAGCSFSASCSVSVEIGGVSASFSGNHGSLSTILEMPSLTLCFEEAEAGDDKAVNGWSMFLDSGCGDDGIDVGTALTDGLSASE